MIGIKLYSNIYFPFAYIKLHLACMILLQMCWFKNKNDMSPFKLFQKFYSICAHLEIQLFLKLLLLRRFKMQEKYNKALKINVYIYPNKP